jgi:hypothetical protein
LLKLSGKIGNPGLRIIKPGDEERSFKLIGDLPTTKQAEVPLESAKPKTESAPENASGKSVAVSPTAEPESPTQAPPVPTSAKKENSSN